MRGIKICGQIRGFVLKIDGEEIIASEKIQSFYHQKNFNAKRVPIWLIFGKEKQFRQKVCITRTSINKSRFSTIKRAANGVRINCDDTGSEQWIQYERRSMSGEEYINAPTLIHKTAKRYHFLLRFIDSAPSIFPFIGRSAIRHPASRAFLVSFIIKGTSAFPRSRPPPVDQPTTKSLHYDATRGSRVVRVSRDCVLKLLDVLDAAMSIANLLTRVWLTTLLISRACTVLSYNDIGIGISRPSRKLFVLVDCAMIFLRHRIVVFAIHLFLMDIFLWQMIGM